MKKLLMILVIVLGARHASPLAAASNRDFEFGLSLFEKGDYYRAITELERFRFFEPKAAESERALRLIGAAYLKGEKWALAAEQFTQYLELYPRSRWARQALYFKGEALYEAREISAARDALSQVRDDGKTDELSRRSAALRLASLDLAAGQYRQAAEQFGQLSAGQKDAALAQRLAAWQQQALAIESMPKLSPSLLLASSALIPGSGQAWAGYRKDGFSAFLLTAAFAGWSIYYFSQNQQTAGWVFAVPATVFYFGNLQGAYLAGKRANRERPRQALRQIYEGIQGLPLPEVETGPLKEKGN